MSSDELTHHTAEVNGIKLHYVIAGTGAPVVLLHGWPQTCHEWRRIIPALAAKYTVVAPVCGASATRTGPPADTISGPWPRTSTS